MFGLLVIICCSEVAKFSLQVGIIYGYKVVIPVPVHLFYFDLCLSFTTLIDVCRSPSWDILLHILWLNYKFILDDVFITCFGSFNWKSFCVFDGFLPGLIVCFHLSVYDLVLNFLICFWLCKFLRTCASACTASVLYSRFCSRTALLILLFR